MIGHALRRFAVSAAPARALRRWPAASQLQRVDSAIGCCSLSAKHSFHRVQTRFCSNLPDTPSSPSNDEVQGPPGSETPGEKFVMVYTCNVCETRAAKTISKHAYYNGVVLVRCPGCENLHLVADRLGWFEDDSTDVESLLRAKGEEVKVVTHENVLELTEHDLLGKSS
ncbi:hypothetical protein Poli38472_003359 [Pythium oligandrum]|uniref:DNL-type domain-containing protein n=1 Tax=Pythium oligandrum TaxID=41045 RepID=A0A8K1FDZ8_PYTOL|nr:hypothetical protein Poli38472_003359 [Pythium oligandrum]|eukprot:TMW57434.1 hypothetical protein Poli38472_003359 [Pythium oligandrum]